MCTFLLPLSSSSPSVPSVSLFAAVPPPPFVLLFLVFLSLLVVTSEQLALLQYRLSMSSMPCQPHAPPGSGTLHTYQVLLPFHSPPPHWGLLEVNLSQLLSQSRVLLSYWQPQWWMLSDTMCCHMLHLFNVTYCILSLSPKIQIRQRTGHYCFISGKGGLLVYSISPVLSSTEMNWV